MRAGIAGLIVLTLGCGRVPLNQWMTPPEDADVGGRDAGSDVVAPVIEAPAMMLSSAVGDGRGWAAAVAALEDGGVVVAGSFAGELLFGPGRMLTSRGEHDAFVARFRKDGSVAWVRQFGDLRYDAATGVASVGFNEVVVTGFFVGSAIFDEGSSTRPPVVLASSGPADQDGFVMRLASDGSVRWVRRVGGPGQETCRAVAGTVDGEAFVTGAVNGGAVFGPGEAKQTTAGSTDGPIFTALFAANGDLGWVRFAGTQANGQGYDVAVGAGDRSPVVAGYFNGTATFGTGSSSVSLPQSAGGGFVARYSHEGDLTWVRQLAGPKGVVDSVDADAEGKIVLAGTFETTGAFGGITLTESTTSPATFVAQLGADGGWHRAAKLRGLVPDRVRWLHDGGLVLLAGFAGSASFGATSNGDPGTTFATRGESDVLVLRFDVSGDLRWVVQVGGPGTDFGSGLAEARDTSVWAAGAGISSLVASTPGAPQVESSASLDGSPFVIRLGSPRP